MTSIQIDLTSLADQGINLTAAFTLQDLPKTLLQRLEADVDNLHEYTSLLLFGHGGKRLWSKLQQSLLAAGAKSKQTSDNIIDDFSRDHISSALDTKLAAYQYRFIYPGIQGLPLQQLGALAGWHFDSPLKLGINANYGLWFAYRAAVLIKPEIKTEVEIPITANDTSPCDSCIDKPCIQACSARAFDTNTFDLNSCLDHRLITSSVCENQCIARLACPVGKEHRYSGEQMQYHYSRSLNMVKQWRRETAEKGKN